MVRSNFASTYFYHGRITLNSDTYQICMSAFPPVVSIQLRNELESSIFSYCEKKRRNSVEWERWRCFFWFVFNLQLDWGMSKKEKIRFSSAYCLQYNVLQILLYSMQKVRAQQNAHTKTCISLFALKASNLDGKIGAHLLAHITKRRMNFIRTRERKKRCFRL